MRPAADTGVSIGEAAQSITVRNCVIYGVQSGVAVKDSSVAIIHNNTIVDSEYGLHLYEKIAGQGGGHATAYNNIIWGVGTNAVLDSLSTVTNRYSDLSGSGVGPGAGNINEPGDVLIANAAIDGIAITRLDSDTNYSTGVQFFSPPSTNAAADRLGFAQMRIVRGGILLRRTLCQQQAAGDHQHERRPQHRPCHRTSLRL